jgi:mannose-6-phosphate isomerase-like protein (cupin superfamily)
MNHMKLIALALGILCISVFAHSAELPADTSKYTIENCVNVFTPSKVESTKAGYQYWFVGKDFIDGRTLKMSVVAPHEATHAPHQHKEDEFFFVLEGTAEFFLNGKTTTAGPYASFYCPSGSLHGIRNAGDTVLKYLVIKKYEKL